MRRQALFLALVIVMVLALAPIASAGEVKGPPGAEGAQGETTPIDGFWTGTGAASICSFSGLNDVIVTDPEREDFEPTRTQSYGTFLVLTKTLLGLSAQDAMTEMGEAPGDSCNPNRGPDPKR